jgi:hypothetical protein
MFLTESDEPKELNDIMLNAEPNLACDLNEIEEPIEQ